MRLEQPRSRVGGLAGVCWVDGATGAREPGDARRTGPSDTCSPIEPKPHVWVGREQQHGHGLVDVKKRVQISPTQPTAGGVGGAVRDEGGAVPGEGEGWCVCAWVAKVSLKPTNGAGRRLHTCAPTVARREPTLSRAGWVWEMRMCGGRVDMWTCRAVRV